MDAGSEMIWEDGSAAAGVVGGGGRKKPSWRERENNKRRERRRRAIAAKIYSGLRAQANFDLPKHCDNNQVLKALCTQAGWIVEPDGTTYRQGCKPPAPAPAIGAAEDIEMAGISANMTPSCPQMGSPNSSSFPSPVPSYQPGPSSSSLPSPSRRNPYPPPSSASTMAAFLRSSIPTSSSLPPIRISNSCPVTPPPTSPTHQRHQTRQKPFDWNSIAQQSFNYPFFSSAVSAPTSPNRGRRFFTPATTIILECDEFDSSTVESSGQWMTFHPAVPISPNLKLRGPPVAQPILATATATAKVDHKGKGIGGFEYELGLTVKAPWKGEKIHEVGIDDLELTLGNGKRPI